MTILVSYPSDDFILMMADSAITVKSTVHKNISFETDTKYYAYPGVGCITTWGDYTFNQLGMYLKEKNISSKNHSVEDLAQYVKKYLDEEYPRDENIELGFHIGGFDRSGEAHLYHAYWGFERPGKEDQKSPQSKINDHSNDILYNGKNSFAYKIITALIKKIETAEGFELDLESPYGRIWLCDLISRFAAEMTPQVGPPFIAHFIFPGNRIEKIENKSFNPMSLQSVEHLFPYKATNIHQPSVFLESNDDGHQSFPTGTSIKELAGHLIFRSEPGTATPRFQKERGC